MAGKSTVARIHTEYPGQSSAPHDVPNSTPIRSLRSSMYACRIALMRDMEGPQALLGETQDGGVGCGFHKVGVVHGVARVS
jgi:hypothetical protein